MKNEKRYYWLTLNECPHGVKSIGFRQGDGETRLTSTKHCGRWEERASWLMTPHDIAEAAALFTQAAEETR